MEMGSGRSEAGASRSCVPREDPGNECSKSAEGFASRLFLGPALRTQPDRRLVTLVREGYEAAFEEIVRRYGSPLGRYAASIVGGRSEDITQDAFSKALLALRRDDAEIELRPWLFRIVRNTALKMLAKARREFPLEDDTLNAICERDQIIPDPASCIPDSMALRAMLDQLEPNRRASLLLAIIDGRTHEEIAGYLKVPVGTVKAWIRRELIAMRRRLE